VAGVRFVQENEYGMKLRFGKVVRHRSGPNKGLPKLYAAGWAWIIPTIEHLRRMHVRQDTINCDNQAVMIKDKTVFNVSAIVIFRVIDTREAVYRVLFEVTNVRQSIQDYCMGVLREVLREKEHTEVVGANTINQELIERSRDQLKQWGIELLSFTLTDCSPDPDTARMILTATQTRFRVHALQEAAEQMGVATDQLDPTLAAALVGTPLVTAIGPGVSRMAKDVKADYDPHIHDEDDD
jgi:regulator of protease activity HflC (stomatin/prohibitin superfamily)